MSAMASTSQPQYIPRKAVGETGEAQGEPRPLSNWRDTDAYVLLAEPGAGKSRAFEREAQETDGLPVTARDFVALSLDRFRNRAPIYIDGLDEIRAGSESSSKPLDEIRRRLDELGRPRFRLSCREADWRSAVDRDRLLAVAPRGEITVLHLAALDDGDIRTLLGDLDVPDPAAFLAQAERKGIRPLLGNPLLLSLMVRAVGRDQQHWPESRTEIYRKACEQLAQEWNEEHLAEAPANAPSVAQLLQDAGLLYSLHLLAGVSGFTTAAQAPAGAVLRIDALPADLKFVNAHAALSSKLFVADTASSTRIPQHRTIAEFLAARAIATRLEAGLPVERVLTLMSGADGGIVDPLRGLHAWLATHYKPQRALLLDRDPLGVVLYGDLTLFSTEEKQQILRALHREAQRSPWFRKGQWHSEPFGALGTPDMAAYFRQLLESPDRSPGHQSLLDCVLDAITHGKAVPAIAEVLHTVVRDQSFSSEIRSGALDAWLKQAPEADQNHRTLLDDIERGTVPDAEDSLAGRLLRILYPTNVTPKEVFRYFHALKRESLYGQYQDFWHRRLIAATPRESLPELLDAWVDHSRPSPGRHDSFSSDRLSGHLLAVTLSAHGDRTSVESIYRWVEVALEEHGFVRLSDQNLQGARRWLSDRPWVLKELVAHGWSQLEPDKASGLRQYWRAESRTLGATRPADWYQWLLEQAAQTNQEDLARYCFGSAAHVAVNPRPEFAMTMDEIAVWMERNRGKWPNCDEWRKEAWSMPLDDWRGERAHEKRERKDKQAFARQQRRKDLLSHIEALKSGTAAAGLLRQIAFAYDERFYDIRGETPADRVQDFLGGEKDSDAAREEARAVIDGQIATLQRTDLPSIDEILETDRKGRSHYIRVACLLGAKLAFERDPDVATNWPDALAGKLAAFWLTDGTGDEPGWYETLAATRPALVAPVLERLTIQQLRKRGETHVTGLWRLAREARFAELARLVVPALLRAFPTRAREPQMRLLSHELLSAVSRHLPRQAYAEIVAERLARKNLDVPQRIAFLVAGLAIDGERYSHGLLRLVGQSETRAAHLGRAIEWQFDERKGAPSLAAPALARLIELLAPFTSPERPTGAHWVGPAEKRQDWVHQFTNQLAADPSDTVQNELKRLCGLPGLAAWKTALQGAMFDQGRARREASFRPTSAEDVASVLANKSPANARDLAALMMDHLSSLEARLRGDDTNGLRLFYRDDRKTPRSENDCRDVLLERLRPVLLELRIDLEKEAQSAQDSRADLRAVFIRPGRRIAMPIEIKKEDHRELWSAWRTQLSQYRLDPNTDGVGIYLVLWFGKSLRSSPEGIRPKSPRELYDALSAILPEELRRRLQVKVLDLSLPQPRK
jgi:hypothetical protein